MLKKQRTKLEKTLKLISVSFWLHSQEGAQYALQIFDFLKMIGKQWRTQRHPLNQKWDRLPVEFMTVYIYTCSQKTWLGHLSESVVNMKKSSNFPINHPPTPPNPSPYTNNKKKSGFPTLTHLTSHTINLQTKTVGLRVFLHWPFATDCERVAVLPPVEVVDSNDSLGLPGDVSWTKRSTFN